MTGPYRRRKAPRQEIDPKAERYYVYRLYAADGQLLYIGRSYDPLQRLRSHHASAADWPAKVVEIEGHGPYTWDEAVRREREEILRKRPPHNIDGVTKKTNRKVPLLKAS